MSEQAAELAIELNRLSNGAVIHRLENIFTHILIDEAQDLNGYDIDIVELLLNSKISVTLVGDGKQAIFKTNYSSKNIKFGGEYLWQTFEYFAKKGKVCIQKQHVSRRFNREICNFANRIYPNENNITTSMDTRTEHDGVYLIHRKDVKKYVQYFHPAVLRWSVSTNTDGFDSINYGACKGQTYDRVLIYPTGKLLDFLLKGKELSSKNKYYVAVTRPRYSIAIVIDSFPKKWNTYMYTHETIALDDNSIDSWHLKPDSKFDAVDNE